MKEATGELNMTVVTVVAIAAVLAFFTLVIWPTIKGTLIATTHCSSAVNCQEIGDGKSVCNYYTEDGKLSEETITCSTKEGQDTTNK